MNKYLLGMAVAAAVAVPAVAAVALHERPTVSRAEANANVREKFAKLDANKDGFITEDEVRGAREANRSGRMEMRFDRLDVDKNGSISRAEFDAGHVPGAMAMDGAHHGHGMKGMHGAMMMRMADADHDGRVSLQEAVTGAMTMFDRADANHDGKVTPEERQALRAKWMATRKS